MTAPTTDTPLVEVAYASWASLQRDCGQQLSRQGLFLKLALDLPQFAKLTVRLRCPDDALFELGAEVVTVVPGSALAVSFSPNAQPVLEQLFAHVAAHPTTDAPDDDDPAAFLAREEPAPEEGSSRTSGPEPEQADHVSLQKQLEAMSVAEKRKLALHGKKEMRLLLIRDHIKTLHPFVIQNPGITLDEIEQIARMTTVNPEVLHTIAKNRDWTRAVSVVRNLVKNPKTPMPDALALLDKLPASDIRALAKSTSVRGPIQAAARKRVASGT